MTEVNDFGFTFEEDVAATVIDTTLKLGSLKDQFDTYDSRVMTFLKNLAANPEKPVINWPDRAVKVTNFIKELENIKNGK